MAVNIGGAVDTKFKTLDIEAPEVERFIKENTGTYSHAAIIGIEVIPEQ